MTDERDNSERRLEGLLRRWGADEAAKQAAPGAFAPARPSPRPAAGGGTLRRWAPAMAAGVLLAAAVGIFVGSNAARREVAYERAAVPAARSEAAATAPAEAAEVARLKGELAKKDAAAAESARALEARDKALAEAALAAEAAKGQLAAAAKKVTDAEAAAAEARRQGETAQARLAAAEADKAKVQDQLKQTQAAGEAAVARLKRIQQALTEETAQLRQMHAEALAAEGKARGELQRVRAGEAMVIGAARKAYMETMGGQRSGEGRVAAMQTAARTRKMLDRRPDAADLFRAGKLREAVSVVEDLLTRLDLVDAKNPVECRKFTEALREKRLSERIEAAMPLTESESLRGWLVEANLILGGPDNAG